MRTTGDLKASRLDPLLHDIDLPLVATLHPLGVRLDIATNSCDVLEAAEECWGRYRPEFPYPPLSFRVIVQPKGRLARPPAFRCHGHLYAVVSDMHNFAIADLDRLSACIFVSEKTAAEHTWLRWFFVEALCYALAAQRYLVPLHAACVARSGVGALLCGPSGAGKSTLAFACARAGWDFVSDDCTFLVTDADDRMAIGKPHHARFRDGAGALFRELEGYVARALPHGKLSIEIPLSAFPEISTAVRCRIGCLVALDRRPGAARAARMPSGEAIEPLLQAGPFYGAEVAARHRQVIGRLLGVPAYRLHYETLDDAIGLLRELAAAPEEP
ncbi:MAG: aldolase [Acidobacteriia bacterium]|nr:aldolase [Terriglobia bacterium]